MPRTLVRWLPAALAPVVIAGVAVIAPMSASAHVSLAPKSAAAVLAMVKDSVKLSGYSGTVEETSALGLPSIPSAGAGSSSSTSTGLDLLTGSHTARIYVSGRTDRRVQVLDSMGERDVVQNGTSVWTWDSAKQHATHVILPARTHASATGTTASDPAAAAREAIAAIGTTTAVTVDDAAKVAGRDAYGIELTPKSTTTLIGSVQLWVDAATGLPLKVAVTARGASTPAVSVGFTDLTIGAPATSLFSFTPPKGATVQTAAPRAATRAPMHLQRDAAARPTVTGSGWDSIVSLPASDAAAVQKATSSPLFTELTTAVAGGRVLHTALVNVLVMNDGRVFAGSVSIDRLVAAAAR